ncbi:MAG: hypothetical protein U5L72_17795 [Bacteroidales bacterium]|nr:hypothetical protein [Bacteroidales bacterium]
MVTTDPVHPLSVSAEGNKLLVIPGENIVGVVEVTVDGSLRNSRGQRLGEPVKRSISFNPVAPGIRSAGRGVIMPSSGSVVYPFLTANLSAVDLAISRSLRTTCLISFSRTAWEMRMTSRAPSGSSGGLSGAAAST